MTASELIEKLKKSIIEIGDVKVVWCDNQECHEEVSSCVSDDFHNLIILR